MDPHSQEYLAAIAGMHEIYGDRPDEHPPEFREDRASVVVEEPAFVAA